MYCNTVASDLLSPGWICAINVLKSSSLLRGQVDNSLGVFIMSSFLLIFKAGLLVFIRVFFLEMFG